MSRVIDDERRSGVMIGTVASRRIPPVEAGRNHAARGRGAPLPRLRDPRTWWRPLYWGISARSAFVSALVVLVAFVIAGTGLAFILYRSLLGGDGDAAAGR